MMMTSTSYTLRSLSGHDVFWIFELVTSSCFLSSSIWLVHVVGLPLDILIGLLIIATRNSWICQILVLVSKPYGACKQTCFAILGFWMPCGYCKFLARNFAHNILYFTQYKATLFDKLLYIVYAINNQSNMLLLSILHHNWANRYVNNSATRNWNLMLDISGRFVIYCHLTRESNVCT